MLIKERIKTIKQFKFHSSDGSMSPKYIIEVADNETAENLQKLKSK